MTTLDPRRATAQPSLPDGALVAAHLAGSRGAGQALVERFHGRLVRRMRWWFRDHAQAEDVVQEAWASAFGSLASFDRSAPFWPWLRAIGDNAARMALRASHRDGRPREAPTPPDRLARAAIAVDPIAGVDDALVLHSLLEQLPDRHRRVVTAVDLEGHCQRDVAAVEGMSHNALRQLLLRARRGLEAAGRAVAGLPIFQWGKLGWTGGAAKATGVGGASAVAGALAVAVPALIVLSLGVGSLRQAAPAHAQPPSVAPFAQLAVTAVKDLATPLPNRASAAPDGGPGAAEPASGSTQSSEGSEPAYDPGADTASCCA